MIKSVVFVEKVPWNFIHTCIHIYSHRDTSYSEYSYALASIVLLRIDK